MSLNITVALVPNGTDMSRELAYVKSALLYADKVNLISPIAYLVNQIAYNELNTENKIINLFKIILPFAQVRDERIYAEVKEITTQLNSTFKSKNYRNIPYSKKLAAISQFKKTAIDSLNTMYDLVGYSDCIDLKKLIDNGQVNITPFRNSIVDVDKYVNEYFEKLTESIHTSNPLFDNASYSLMNAALKAKLIKFTDLEKAKITHVGLVDNYLQRLPSFEEASIDELIDIKNELSKPLIRFRSKMMNYSEGIKSLPWDKDFENECNTLFIKEIEPALLEIEEATQDNSFKKNLGSKFLTQEGFWKSYNGLVVGIATTGVISTLNEFTLNNGSVIAGVGAGVAAKFIEAVYEYEKGKKDIEKNELYFYYKTGDILKKRK